MAGNSSWILESKNLAAVAGGKCHFCKVLEALVKLAVVDACKAGSRLVERRKQSTSCTCAKTWLSKAVYWLAAAWLAARFQIQGTSTLVFVQEPWRARSDSNALSDAASQVQVAGTMP